MSRFNHTVENHVHLEVYFVFTFLCRAMSLTIQSDYLVCPECGSLGECTHDWDELHASNLSLRLDHHLEHDTCYEMISNTGIPPNVEVFNTYGETLTNSQLLNQYGFVLDVNEHDRLEWSAQEILDACVQSEETEDCVVARIFKAGEVILNSLSNLSYFFNHSQLVCRGLDAQSLYLNDEGNISAGLWASLAAFALLSRFQFTDNIIDSEKQLTEIAEIQLRMESFSEEADNRVERSPASDIVLQIARYVDNLCDRRKRQSGKPDSFECNLSDLLEVSQCHLLHLVAINGS